MTTTPTILSEQEITGIIAEWEDAPGYRGHRDLIRFAESKIFVKLAEGVELEATFWHDDETGEVIAASMHGGGASFEALIPLSTAQAAVAAERAKAHRCKGLLREGCDYLASCGSICKKCGREHTLSIQSSPAPAAEPTGSAEMIDVLETIELGLARGYAPADLLDENSPVRDKIRAAIKIAKGDSRQGSWLLATPSPQPAHTVPADRAGLVEECKRLAGEYATAVGQTVLAETEERSNARLAVATSLVRKLHAAIDRLASSAVQVPNRPLYVACRECDECGHAGINDGHATDAACCKCDWRGTWPADNECPDCKSREWMSIACPKCSGRYRLIADKDLASSAAQVPEGRVPGFIKPDTDEAVFFYEQDFYMLSNFSSFNLRWKGHTFPTSEHAYHWEKFAPRTRALGEGGSYVRDAILDAPSAHEVFKLAERYKSLRRADWDDVKVGIMRDILRAKAQQHEYVRRKLLATGDRELIEDSWRDDFWGWGPNRDGQNMLGKLWMEIRAMLAAAPAAGGEHG